MADEGNEGNSHMMINSKSNSTDADDGQEPPAALDETTQALIGAQLKAMYSAICEEPVPAQLLDLINQLDNAKVTK